MKLRVILISVLLALAGCSLPPGMDQYFGGQVTPSRYPDFAVTPDSTPVTTAEPTPIESWDAIEIWLPPQFDPAGSSAAGQVLQKRLNAFQLETGVRVRVRIKSEAGTAGLLQSVSLTKAAAPQNLPALVLLSRQDMETAALKGYLVSLDGRSLLIDDPDWYPFAQQMAFIQGSQFGLPMAGDALLTVYRPAQVGTRPASWEAVSGGSDRIVFPAADLSALVTVAAYLSAGGKLQDAQGRLQVEREPLIKVLEVYNTAARSGLFPANIVQYQTDANSWQAYTDNSADIAITWASRYLAQLPADSVAVTVPGIEGSVVSLGTAWMLTLTDPLVTRQPVSVALAEYLCDPTFQAELTAAAGYLPTRPSALDLWKDQSLRATMNSIIQTTHALPSNDVIFSIGPLFQDAVLQVIRQQSTPIESADEVLERLQPPEVNT